MSGFAAMFGEHSLHTVPELDVWSNATPLGWTFFGNGFSFWVPALRV